MHFREFIVNEAGLGDLGMRMDRLFQNRGFQSFAGAYLSSDVAQDEPTVKDSSHAIYTPSVSMTIPKIERVSRIKILDVKRTPIYVELADGTRCMFSYDQFRRIKGEPAVGKTMRIVFQRHQRDLSENPSKIEAAEVIDG